MSSLEYTLRRANQMSSSVYYIKEDQSDVFLGETHWEGQLYSAFIYSLGLPDVNLRYPKGRVDVKTLLYFDLGSPLCILLVNIYICICYVYKYNNKGKGYAGRGGLKLVLAFWREAPP